MKAGSKLSRGVMLGAMVLAAAGLSAAAWKALRTKTSSSEGLTLSEVRRTDLFPVLTAGGQVESSKRTVIECQVENMVVGVRGQRLYSGSSSVLLSIVPEGTTVKKGDVLAVIDASNYDELLRVQQIDVERARSDEMQADLNHEITRLAINQFREGLMQQTIDDMRGAIMLARTELQRAKERLAWTIRMKEKGYVPTAMVTSDRFREQQLEVDLKRRESALEVYEKFTAPKFLRQYEGAEAQARITLEYQKMRLKRHIDRLERIQKQVENCTIRAPHDGYVIHANDPRRQKLIEPGMEVRQRQPLIYLPDLNNMEVVASLHESIVDRVHPNYQAKVQIEAMEGRVVEGHITSVAPIATADWRSDVHYFAGIIKLDSPPEGLRPGMTAEVEISMPRREDVLAIPPQAITNEDGHDFCFVVHEDGLERREIVLGETTDALAEIRSGLREGEQVVLNPPDDPESRGFTILDDPSPHPAEKTVSTATQSDMVAATR